ncbi:MAG: MucB/RseB C-terminal domain-containing protein [Gallionellaceae bacterium]|jgi:sigma-E factor negative regulatory protein RseB|nr:MucB/RseB C-terminal domain-containing protein [Gallionellaceae bacterium]
MKSIALLVLLYSTATSASAAALFSPNDPDSLQNLALAARKANYAGTFVYQSGDRMEISRIAHFSDDTGEYSRLERLDGPRREIVRRNNETWCYLGERRVRVDLSQSEREFPDMLPKQLALMKENYTVSGGEESRVAGFPVRAILFRPKDDLRYTHKMWAEDGSGLLLKTEVIGKRGRIIEQYTFTQLSLGDGVDRQWVEESMPDAAGKRDAGQAKRNARSAPSDAGKPPPEMPAGPDPHMTGHMPMMGKPVPVVSGWQVSGLPSGFKKITEVRRKLPGKDAPVVQLVFSDGLAGISVFIEKIGSDADTDDREGLSSQGLIQAYGKLVGDYLVTVIGEVPPRTVMQVADSVRNTDSK